MSRILKRFAIVGKNSVMYRAVADRRAFGDRPGRVEKTYLHGNFIIVNSRYERGAFPPEEIIHRAESKVGLSF